MDNGNVLFVCTCEHAWRIRYAAGVQQHDGWQQQKLTAGENAEIQQTNAKI